MGFLFHEIDYFKHDAIPIKEDRFSSKNLMIFLENVFKKNVKSFSSLLFSSTELLRCWHVSEMRWHRVFNI